MYDDDYEYDDWSMPPMRGLRDRSSRKCKHTHKTRYRMRDSRPNVAERSSRVGEPCLDEGVVFSQKMICDDY